MTTEFEVSDPRPRAPATVPDPEPGPPIIHALDVGQWGPSMWARLADEIHVGPENATPLFYPSLSLRTAASQSEADTLAGWGTLPYVITNGCFQTTHSYPTTIQQCMLGRPYYPTMDILTSVECNYPFTLTVGKYTFHSEFCGIDYAVNFPNGLPLFYLSSKQLLPESVEAGPVTYVKFAGEILSGRADQGPAPMYVEFQVTDNFTETTMCIEDGNITPVPDLTDLFEAQDDLDNAHIPQKSMAAECLEHMSVRDYFNMSADDQLAIRDILQPATAIDDGMDTVRNIFEELEEWYATDFGGDTESQKMGLLELDTAFSMAMTGMYSSLRE